MNDTFCKISGIQFDPEAGVTSADIKEAARFLGERSFVIWDVEGNNAKAYLLVGNEFDTDLCELEKGSIIQFIKGILNDMNKESPDGFYSVRTPGLKDAFRVRLVYANG